MIGLILLILAFLLCLIAAFQPWTQPFPRPHLGWLGMATYLLSLILGGAGVH